MHRQPCHHCPPQAVSSRPTQIYENYYHPRVVQVVHPIEVVRRHHCVPVPHHVYCVTVKDEFVR